MYCKYRLQELKLVKTEALSKSPGIEEFLIACLTICWKMVIQTPSMKFEYPKPGTQFDERKQTIGNFDSRPAPGMIIEYVVHPALYHGETLMYPASVILHVLQSTSKTRAANSDAAGQMQWE